MEISVVSSPSMVTENNTLVKRENKQEKEGEKERKRTQNLKREKGPTKRQYKEKVCNKCVITSEMEN